MPIALTQVPGGVHNYTYQGNVTVAGAPASLQVDLDAIPEYIRKEQFFEEMLYVNFKALDASVTGADKDSIVFQPDANGVPISFTVNVTSSSSTGQIYLQVEPKHTRTR